MKERFHNWVLWVTGWTDERTDGYWDFFAFLGGGLMHVSWIRPVFSRAQGGEASGSVYQVICLNTPMALATPEWAGKLAYTRTRKHSNEAPTNNDDATHTHRHRMVRNAMSLLGVRLLGERIYWRIWYDSVGTGRVFGRQHGQDNGGSGQKPARTECFRQAALDDGLSGKDVRLAIASLFFSFPLSFVFFSPNLHHPESNNNEGLMQDSH
ncbi:hypothetical protein HDV62DRAFT_141227 [Trichoderma sp. SZMC 28011]